MANLRFMRFDDHAAFIEATEQFDDSFMNFSLGSIFDYANGPDAALDPPNTIYLLAIYRGDDLLITLTRNKNDFAWLMSTPCTAEEALAEPGVLPAATALLANSLFAQVKDNTAVFDKIIGPEDAVNAFLEVWVALRRAQGQRVRLTESPFFNSRASYVTRESLPPLPAAIPSGHAITQATEADLDAVAELYQAFQAAAPWKSIITKEEAVKFVRRPIASRLVWVCRASASASSELDASNLSKTVEGGGALAGYILLGRVTPRTIAIKNVYVCPAHRRKGIAEALVRGVTRYYLGVRPYGVEGVDEGPPNVGLKEEVNLNVSELGAERVYKRSGFLFPDRSGDEVTGGLNPVTGRKGWYASIWRGIEYQPEPEPESELESAKA